MKKLLLFISLSISIGLLGQKTNLSKFTESSRKIAKSEILKSKNVLDFKIDSIITEKNTKKELILNLMTMYSTKEKELLEYITEEREIASNLPREESIPRFDELTDLLFKTDYAAKSKILLNKYEDADGVKTFVITSKAYYNIVTQKNGTEDFISYIYYKPSGERIDDIYKYFISNQ